MNFETDLVKLLPRKFRTVDRLKEFLEACGEILNEMHQKIDGLPDLQNPDTVPASYIPYLAALFGIGIPETPGTVAVSRKRMMLKSLTQYIKSKGLKSLFSDLAYFYYLSYYIGASVDVYELWTNDYQTFHLYAVFDSYTPPGWIGDGVTTNFTTYLRGAPVRPRTLVITALDWTNYEMVVYDDGQGNLVGDLGSGNNIINYTNGWVDVTFEAPVKNGAKIVVTYELDVGRYLSPHFLLLFSADIYWVLGGGDVYLGRRRFDSLIARLKEIQPAHTVMQIDYGSLDEFWRIMDAPAVWAATTAYSLGDMVVPTISTGYIYECTTAGTSGASEPTWPTEKDETVTDGTVEWTTREFRNRVDDLISSGMFETERIRVGGYIWP